MAVTRKISNQKSSVGQSRGPKEEAAEGQAAVAPRKKRVCQFCQNKTQPSYTDSQVLRKFMSDRSRIVPRQRSGVCSKHQRALSKEIKHARHLALLPFVASI